MATHTQMVGGMAGNSPVVGCVVSCVRGGVAVVSCVRGGVAVVACVGGSVAVVVVFLFVVGSVVATAIEASKTSRKVAVVIAAVVACKVYDLIVAFGSAKHACQESSEHGQNECKHSSEDGGDAVAASRPAVPLKHMRSGGGGREHAVVSDVVDVYPSLAVVVGGNVVHLCKACQDCVKLVNKCLVENRNGVGGCEVRIVHSGGDVVVCINGHDPRRLAK